MKTNDFRKNEIKKIVENCKHFTEQSIIDAVDEYIDNYQKYEYGGGEPS